MIIIPIKYLGKGKEIYSKEEKNDNTNTLKLLAAIDEKIIMEPGDIVSIPTGMQMSIPDGFEGQVRPNDKLAVKHGITVINTPGTVDADFRGELQVILINHGKKSYVIENGTPIASLNFSRIAHVDLIEVNRLEKTERGKNGFGHTG